MRAIGVICECNPMHEGHRYLISQARASGADAVICVMSGCFTQRAEPAILDPRTRARILLSGGADAVLELPFPYSAAGAEFFASAGVSILDRLGVNEIWFGSECGDLEMLSRMADTAASSKFAERYRSICKSGAAGTAQAYADCLRECGGLNGRLLPNDILGIAYLCALRRRASSMQAHTVKRLGNGYSETELYKDEIPSASALRAGLLQNGISAWKPYMGAADLNLISEQIDCGLAPALWRHSEAAVLAHFRLIDPDALDSVPELAGGLGRRVAELAHRATSFSALLSQAVTKKYTEARVRRGILFAMTGVTDCDLRAEPAYAVLLAANRCGCAFLKERKRRKTLDVVTAHANLPHNDAAARQAFLTHRAFALYTLCLPQKQPVDAFLRCSAFMEAASASNLQDECEKTGELPTGG